MASKCTKCGSTENYNFVLNIGLCDPCIGGRIEELEDDYTDLKEIQVTDYNHAVRNAERIKALEAALNNLDNCLAIMANTKSEEGIKDLPKLITNLREYIKETLKGK